MVVVTHTAAMCGVNGPPAGEHLSNTAACAVLGVADGGAYVIHRSYAVSAPY